MRFHGFAVLALSVLVVPIAYGALTTAPKLAPTGPATSTLSASGTAEADWNSFIQVHDGSVSAYLTASGDGDAAKVDISPINKPLDSPITFWAYFEDNDGAVPRIDLVLSNGRRLEGYRNTEPVTGTKAELVDEVDLGYPAVSLWTKMRVASCPNAGSECGFYSSFAGIDPLIPGTYGISSPKNLDQWLTLFPGARIVQVRIAYGDDVLAGPTPYSIYVDGLRIGSTNYDIER